MNDFVLSLLPELGTMGSKRGGVGVTRSSTSYAVWLYYRFNLSHCRDAVPFRSTVSSTIYGTQLTRTVKLLMYIFKPGATVQQQSGFSSVF